MGDKDKPTAEDGFRSALQDVATVLERVAPYCGSLEEAAGMVRLALENDGQLRLLLDLVTKKK